MVARIFKIEMAPIVSYIDINYNRFDPSNEYNPNLRELMGLNSAIIHVLTPRDKETYSFQVDSNR